MGGYISTEFTVWCGRCAEWEQFCVRNKRLAGREAKKRGWSLTRAEGWLCPDCAGNGGKQRDRNVSSGFVNVMDDYRARRGEENVR